MALVDKSKRSRIDIPWEQGQWVEVALLTGPELDEAEDVATRGVMTKYAGIDLKTGDIEVDPETRARQEEDRRYKKYDWSTLCRLAIKGWSYEPEVSPETVALLDAATRDLVARFVVDQNVRPEAFAGSTGSS